MFINHVLKFVKLRVKYVCTGSENTNLGTERKITIINAKKKKKKLVMITLKCKLICVALEVLVKFFLFPK